MSGAQRRRRWLRLLTLMAAAGFALSVFLLQRAQPGYDPLHQLMSELALGPRGEWMLGAFVLLALGIACAALYMRACTAHWPLVACMAFAALMLCGAGLVTLQQSANIHVGMVALAFRTCSKSVHEVRCPAKVGDARRKPQPGWWPGEDLQRCRRRFCRATRRA